MLEVLLSMAVAEWDVRFDWFLDEFVLKLGGIVTILRGIEQTAASLGLKAV